MTDDTKAEMDVEKVHHLLNISSLAAGFPNLGPIRDAAAKLLAQIAADLLKEVEAELAKKAEVPNPQFVQPEEEHNA